MNHILIILLMFGGILFIYLGLGGPLFGGGKIETQKFGVLAVVIGILFSLGGGLLHFMRPPSVTLNEVPHGESEISAVEEQVRLLESKLEATEKARLDAEQARVKAEEKAKVAEQQSQLQTETANKATIERLKAEMEIERTRLKDEAQTELARLKKEIEIERARRLKMEVEATRTQPDPKIVQVERTSHPKREIEKLHPVQDRKLPASFDCEQASTKVEKLICSDEELSDADGRLGKIYAQLVQSVEEPETLKEEQKKWLSRRDEQLELCHEEIQCVLQIYEDRIVQLTSQISALTSQDSPAPTSTKQWWGIVTTSQADSLNIRAEMDTRSKIIDTIAQGEKVLVLADYGKWYKVQASENTIGFAVSQFIRSDTAQQWGTVVTEASDLNVRSEMNANASVVGKVKKNSKILVIGNHGDWYQIQLENGHTGYVSSQFIHLVK